MSDPNYETLYIGFDSRVDPQFFCYDSMGMISGSDDFGEFYFNLASNLDTSKNVCGFPPRDQTGLENIEFTSISILVRDHNSSVLAGRDLAQPDRNVAQLVS